MYERIVRLPTAADVADAVARRFLTKIVALQTQQPMVNVCLTGGETANQMYEQFAALAPESGLDATKLQLWWGDERFVPATDPDRNSLQAITRLARTVELQAASIHMMPSAEGRLDPHQCADEYAAELGATSFDITLLGVGPDGHIGSIFPNHPSFEPTSKAVIGVTESPKPPEQRISLSIDTFNRSEQIWFIATGASKAEVIARAIDRDPNLPASGPRGQQATYWFLDAEAAADLPTQYSCLL